jgi:hypothetical protein
MTQQISASSTHLVYEPQRVYDSINYGPINWGNTTGVATDLLRGGDIKFNIRNIENGYILLIDNKEIFKEKVEDIADYCKEYILNKYKKERTQEGESL